MNIQSQLKSALSRFLESGEEMDLCRLINDHPDLISKDFGEYPDVHRLVDLKVGELSYRFCRQISLGELIIVAPVARSAASTVKGVPLWLTGEKLAKWASDEEEKLAKSDSDDEENPSDGPTDWDLYR